MNHFEALTLSVALAAAGAVFRLSLIDEAETYFQALRTGIGSITIGSAAGFVAFEYGQSEGVICAVALIAAIIINRSMIARISEAVTTGVATWIERKTNKDKDANNTDKKQ